MARQLAVAVAGAPRASVAATFYRHASFDHEALKGSSAGGRWGPPDLYPVLYLGRPPGSVVGEAYRHLVDDVEGMRPELVAPRRFVTCRIAVGNLLDLRTPEAVEAVGLRDDDLYSAPGDDGACQRVGRVAHQLELHGVIAPAATRLGETLALFEQHLTPTELPVLVKEDRWQGLPPDPRRLRAI
jgi:RES domain-containing protein